MVRALHNRAAERGGMGSKAADKLIELANHELKGRAWFDNGFAETIAPEERNKQENQETRPIGKGTLLPGELKLLTAAAEGGAAELAEKGDKKLDNTERQVRQADGTMLRVVDPPGVWGPHRLVRAELIAWLATDKQAAELVAGSGLHLRDARVVGTLNFNGATALRDVFLERCHMPDSADFVDATVRNLGLPGCRVAGGIAAERLRASGMVAFRDGFRCEGMVNLRAARIEGQLDCSGGSFKNPGGTAILADGIHVGADVFLHAAGAHRFEAEGMVNLRTARIEGPLDCSGGSFKNPGGTAIEAGGIHVGDSVFLSAADAQRFEAEGRLNFLLARIGGFLHLYHAEVDGRKKDGKGGDVDLSWASASAGLLLMPLPQVPSRDSVSPASIAGVLNLQHFSTAVLCDDARCWRAGGAEPEKGWLAELKATPRRWKARLWRWLGRPEPITPGTIKGVKLLGFRYGVLTEKSPTDAATRLAMIRLDEGCRPGGNELHPQPYEHAAAVLDELGHDDEAVEVRKTLFRSRRWHAWRSSHGTTASDPNPSRRPARDLAGDAWRVLGRAPKFLGSVALDVLVGGGYNRWRPAWFLLGVWGVGVLAFGLGNHAKLKVPAAPDVLVSEDYEAPKRKVPDDYPTLNAWVYSLDVMLPIIDLRQEAYWVPLRQGPAPQAGRYDYASLCLFGYEWEFEDAGRYLRWYLWLHTLAGWTLFTVLAVSLSGLIKPERPESHRTLESGPPRG